MSENQSCLDCKHRSATHQFLTEGPVHHHRHQLLLLLLLLLLRRRRRQPLTQGAWTLPSAAQPLFGTLHAQ
jgi:hypothetical protein